MKIKYFYDPLCGWCYGASPALEKAEAIGITVETYAIGLFAGTNGPLLSPEWADYAWTNDQRIQKITGQVFSQDYRDKVLSNFGKRFDSWLPTVAVAAHEAKFPGQGLEFLRAIQKARYIEGLDNTDPEVLAKVAQKVGWNAGEFSMLLLDQKFQQQTQHQVLLNLAAHESYRAKGVPLLVLEEDGEERILNSSLVFNKNPNPVEWLKTQKHKTAL